jgi:lysophospholipase L1-like esterase
MIFYLWEFSLMRITYPSILILALTLAACGGGGSDVGTQQTPVGGSTGTSGGGTTTPKTGGLVEYYGDSTVWGWKTNSTNSTTGDRVSVPAPTAFVNALNAESGSPGYQVANEGKSGTTACQLLAGTDGHPPWDQQLTALKGRWLIVNHAINDRNTDSVSSYKECLRQLVRKAKAARKEAILETPNPIVPDGLLPYVQAMREVAAEEGTKLIDQYQYLTSYLNGRPVSEIVPDGLHPTEAVYELKGKYAAQVFSTKVNP